MKRMKNKQNRLPDGKKAFIAILLPLLLPFTAKAWMEPWAPVFPGVPAKAEVLPSARVNEFVSSVKAGDESWDAEFLKYCTGYSLDLNGDGRKDDVYLIPWMGCGLAATGYHVHFRVSAGADGWTDTVVEGRGVSKDDLSYFAGKIYFRHSAFFGEFEKSKHNHWVYQVFSFDKSGVMRCGNDDFAGLFPAVTIYYINPRFKQIELTKGDLKKIEKETKQGIRQTGPASSSAVSP